MHCPYCQSEHTHSRGKRQRADGTWAHRFTCQACGRQFNDRSGTPMARMNISIEKAERILRLRSEGVGMRAAGRLEGVSHATVAHIERKLAGFEAAWSPPAPADSDLTLEADELYTRVERNRPASKVQGGS